MQWRRDLWLAILTIGTVAFVVGERILSTSDEPGLVAPVLVIGVMTAPMAFYAACRGRHFTLPTWVVVAAVAIAAVLGSVMSGLLGYYALLGLGPVATVAVSLVEESVTLLVPLAALFALPTRRASDGLLVGAAAGGGFAVAQTVGYLVTLPSVVGPSAHDVLLRGWLAPAAQLAWGGITALALWLAAQEHWNGRSLRRLVLAITGVVALHALWEGAHGVAVRVLLTVLSAALLGWVVVRTVARRGVSTRVLPRSAAPTRGATPPRAAASPRGAAPTRGAARAESGGVAPHEGSAGSPVQDRVAVNSAPHAEGATARAATATAPAVVEPPPAADIESAVEAEVAPVTQVTVAPEVLPAEEPPVQAPLTGMAEGEWEPVPTPPASTEEPPRVTEKPSAAADETAPRGAANPRPTAPRTAGKPGGTKKPNGARKPGPAAPRAKKSTPRPTPTTTQAAATEPGTD
ncbi:PrsW family glutamic-type intramembrane protease [Cryptosporangium japonicum]|uniref:RsiW-degrading membrane proteinase PrsW (M82 family) n=1 Tax=Cryptosporangium japonicum TaxID=80872 RepID=A0ABN0UVW5_9ACTN